MFAVTMGCCGIRIMATRTHSEGNAEAEDSEKNRGMWLRKYDRSFLGFPGLCGYGRR